MNTIAFLRQSLAYFCFFVASAFILSTLAYLMRRQLRMIFDRWRALGKLGQCVTLIFVLGFIAYGGTKHQLPRQQTDSDMEKYGPLLPTLPALEPVGSAPRADRGDASVDAAVAGRRALPIIPSQAPQASSLGATLVSQSDTSGLIPISSWTARGAYDDWKRIQFPDGFAFPIGTNAITEITLMANGALRTSLTNTTSLVSLPYAVSLEPDVSSVSYGYSPSNSFLIAWSNACVERSATNRVDATIELFASGDIQTTVYDHSTFNVQHSTFLPAPLPEGWTGEGQDSTWAANAFPSNATEIAEDGYDSWLTDRVGINEQNGRYKASITVMSLPMSGGPCYLECGPYKVVVKEPGVYSFPLEVFEHYTARTYPEAVPLSVEYDDGYRGEDSAMLQSSDPARLASFPMPPTILDIYMIPEVHLSPSTVSVSEAAGTHVSVWCNMANATRRFFSSLSGLTQLVIGGSNLEIEEAEVADLVEVFLESDKGTARGTISIYEDEYHQCEYCSESGCPCGAWCFDVCDCHATDSNGVIRCIGPE